MKGPQMTFCLKASADRRPPEGVLMTADCGFAFGDHSELLEQINSDDSRKAVDAQSIMTGLANE